jgi:hypothetical protein
MPRFTAGLLLALVGLMALLPQAMCPCAVAARAASVRTAEAPSPVRACCKRCGPARRAAESTPSKAPSDEDRSPCPCCALNGDGKMLVLMGETVRADASSAPSLLLAWEPAHAASSLSLADVEVAPSAHSHAGVAPHERRAGVVLLI